MSSPTAAPRRPRTCAGGTRGLGGCGGAVDGEVAGRPLGLSGELSAPPTPHQPPPALPGSPVAPGVGSRECSALLLPVMRGLGEGDRGPTHCGGGRGRPQGSPAGAEGGGTERVGDLSGAGQLVSKGDRSTRFLLWGRRRGGGRWWCVWTEHYSQRSGVIQNEAEVRDQARAEDVRKGEVHKDLSY